MELNTKTLKVFVELARTGSFSRAAKELGLSQPAVSLQIQSLEKELGLTLVDRSRGGCRLTEAGKAFLHHAQRILKEEELLHSKLEGLKDEVAGDLEIAASNIPGEFILPRILPEYMEKYPMVRIRLNVTDSKAALEMVRAGQVDIGFVGSAVDDERLESGVLCSDILVVIAHPGSELARRESVHPEDLALATWLRREEGSGTGAHMERALKEWGITPREGNMPVLGSTTAVIQAVVAGAGISMASLWAAADLLGAGKLAMLRLPGIEQRRQFHYVTLRRWPASAPAKAFIQMLEESRPRLEQELERLWIALNQGPGADLPGFDVQATGVEGPA